MRHGRHSRIGVILALASLVVAVTMLFWPELWAPMHRDATGIFGGLALITSFVFSWRYVNQLRHRR